MRAIFGLLCLLSVTPTPNTSEDPLARAEKVAAVEMLLDEIASQSDQDANGLSEDLAAAVDRWTSQIDRA